MSGNLLNRIPGFNEAVQSELNRIGHNPAADAIIRGLGPLQPGNGLSGGKPYRMSGGDMVITGEEFPVVDPAGEDTTKI